MLKILLDTDIGGDIDDALCLAYLLREPQCELLGISTVCGNSEARAAVADAICKAAGRNIPIVAGRDLPLQPIPLYPTPDGAAALSRWPHSDFTMGDAPEFLYRKIAENPGEITLVAIGNLTNVAELFRRYPDSVSLLKEIYIMTGYFGTEPLPEAWYNWNAWADPLAAKIICEAPVTKRIFPLEVTQTLTIDAALAKACLPDDSAMMRAVYDFGSAWLQSSGQLTLHDPLTAVSVFHPEICEYTAGCVDVSLADGATAFRPDPQAHTQIATVANRARFWQLLASTVTNRRRAVPPMVAGKAIAAGDIGIRWLNSLDSIVESLEKDWNITAGRAMNGGSRAFVAEVLGPNGEDMILKVELPDNDEGEYLNGIRALQLADGRGYAKVYACDPARRACLMERLGGPMKKTSLSPARQMEIICGALHETWDMPVDGAGLPVGGTQWFRDYIPDAWEQLALPCASNVIALAMRYLSTIDQMMDSDSFVLVHGDAHNNNMLQTLDGKGFKLIDPDGMIFEKAYDLGVLMREWPDEYAGDEKALGLARSEFLSGLTGVPAKAIWRWGYLQMVATSLILLQCGETALGRQMLAIAEKWCQ